MHNNQCISEFQKKCLLPSLIEVALMLILIRKDAHNFNIISVQLLEEY